MSDNLSFREVVNAARNSYLPNKVSEDTLEDMLRVIHAGQEDLILTHDNNFRDAMKRLLQKSHVHRSIVCQDMEVTRAYYATSTSCPFISQSQTQLMHAQPTLLQPSVAAFRRLPSSPHPMSPFKIHSIREHHPHRSNRRIRRTEACVAMCLANARKVLSRCIGAHSVAQRRRNQGTCHVT